MRDEMELVVCTTCRLPASCPAAPRDGARLSAALDRCGIPHRPHRCLSACSRGCVVVLRGAGRWTFVLGGLDPDRDADALREMIGAYRAAPAGLVPWRERPGVVRSNTIARIPPRRAAMCPETTTATTTVEKTPVTIVTGFLGSGKTTLIRHLLQNPDGRRLAVLVNEFGDVGVDGDLIRACADANCPEANIVELANGCICCTVADEFIPAIERLLAMDPPPDHILIETSGLALPKPLLKAFDWPDLRSRITIDGVVTVADAEAVAAGLFAPDPARPGNTGTESGTATGAEHETPLSEVFEDQIACADLVLLSKADLAGEGGLAEARRVIAAEAPRVLPMLPLTDGVIDARVVLGISAAAEDDLAARPSHHDDGSDHEHDDFDTIVVDLPEIDDPQALADKVAALAGAQKILRIKGHVAVRAKPLRLLVQAVGPRVRHQFDRPWGSAPRHGRLVVIAEKGDLAPAAVRAALA